MDKETLIEQYKKNFEQIKQKSKKTPIEPVKHPILPEESRRLAAYVRARELVEVMTTKLISYDIVPEDKKTAIAQKLIAIIEEEIV